MIFELLRWWYGAGWAAAFSRITERTASVSHAFSVPILLKTLFAPWRRIVTSGAKGLDAKMQALLDNLVSRTVGFVSRFVMLIAAAVVTLGTFLLGAAIALAWPLIPFAIVYLFVRGIV